MTVPDPYDSRDTRAPQTRRALREMRERAADRVPVPGLPQGDGPAARTASQGPDTQPVPVLHVAARLTPGAAHPPIFKAPPPPRRVVRAPVPPLLDENELAARHARRRRPWHTSLALAAAAALLIAGGGTAAALAFGTTPNTPVAAVQRTAATAAPEPEPPAISVEASAPQPHTTGTTPELHSAMGTPLALPLCATPTFTHALAQNDDAAAIAVAGGGDAFRDAVVDGLAPCVRLNNPSSVWVVADKQRPLQPLEYAPAPLVKPAGVQSVLGTPLRADAASALSQLVAAADKAGVGQIALQSGYRSYQTQVSVYHSEIGMFGKAKADMVSARPGYSEHQTGLAADVVACTAGRCGTLDDLAASPQGKWVAANSWKYGWIVRYVAGATPATGYDAEPWHLRYIGPDLAAAYHAGGYRSLEQFFGLPDAPDYAD